MRFLLLLIVLFSSVAVCGEWHVDQNAENKVKFISKVVVLEFEGVTDQIDGYLYWDGEELFTGNSEVMFEVDLNSVDTGIGKRDRDMRDVLKTSEWQYARFTGAITEVNSETDNSYKILARGKMFIHGQEKEIDVPGMLSKVGDLWRVQADWQILLADYQVEAPSLAAFVKVAQEIDLKVDFYLSEAK